MNIVLWILQVLAALFFIFHAYTMAFRYNDEQTRERMSYMADLPSPLRNFIALCELLGGLGLILPALTSILPELTAWAGAGLAVIMILAVPYHIRRQEYPNIALNLILFALVAFIAYGRFALEPF